MSFSREKREIIKKYILQKLQNGEEDFITKTVDAFDVSRQSVYKYLRELLDDDIIIKKGKNYSVKEKTSYFCYNVMDEKMDEDRIFDKDILPEIKDYSENVIRMWRFCFTEMMNNAIDHSGADKITVSLVRNNINTRIIIHDNGAGIFRKIKEYYKFDSLDDAIVELFKGKLTTDKLHHSGEGIFFTSRIVDFFAAVSDKKVFSHSEYKDYLTDISADSDNKFDIFGSGTTIIMRLSNASNKTNKQIMDMYADVDGGFTRTRIPVKHLFDDYPVSRSQAKRLYNRLESFEEVELDFEGVEEIGQGFAHELFVVFKKIHPETKLIPFNMGLQVQRMINHVTNS